MRKKLTTTVLSVHNTDCLTAKVISSTAEISRLSLPKDTQISQGDKVVVYVNVPNKRSPVDLKNIEEYQQIELLHGNQVLKLDGDKYRNWYRHQFTVQNN